MTAQAEVWRDLTRRLRSFGFESVSSVNWVCRRADMDLLVNRQIVNHVLYVNVAVFPHVLAMPPTLRESDGHIRFREAGFTPLQPHRHPYLPSNFATDADYVAAYATAFSDPIVERLLRWETLEDVRHDLAAGLVEPLYLTIEAQALLGLDYDGRGR